MAQNLFEAYKARLQVADKVYAKTHLGESMDSNRRLAVAKCLDNMNRFMNEAFNNSTGTQRSDLGMYKKFTLNLVNVALPNLIAYDLVIVNPMTSMSGYVTYVNYTAGSNKGSTTQGTVFNNPFKLGDVDVNYTSEKVVEAKTTAQTGTLNWTPVIAGSVEFIVDGVAVTDNGQGALSDGGTINYETGAYSLSGAASTSVLVNYVYDNVKIPQNDLPLLNAKIESIPLVAKARRIAVYYSQIAAFQAKTDYGFDLGEQLSEKAVGQLNYEIDTEVTQLLIDNATQDGDLVWSKTLPVGVSKTEHYEGFAEIVEIGKQKVYDRTKRFAPTYMLIASNVLPILSFMKNFTAAPATNINGPYFAGTLGSLKVFVTPNIAAGHFVLGVNGSDLMSSAAVYAPYMPIVPTQLLGFADGAMSQGFSTLYDLKLLNQDLLVAGRITA